MFDEEFLPDKLLFREAEAREASFWIKAFFEGKPKQNLLFLGSTGLGKTALAKLLLKNFPGIYVNAWRFRSSYAMLSEILRNLGIPVPEKGRGLHELLAPFLAEIEEKKILLVLDEIDKASELDLLYEISPARNCMILGIANRQDFLARMDPRVLSRFRPVKIEFKPYSPEQIEEILKARLKLAQASLDEERLRVISHLAYKQGSDIRLALKLLAQTLLKDLSIEEIASLARGLLPKKVELSSEEEKLLEIIRSKPGLTSGEIFEEFRKIKKLSDRAIREKLRKLERLGLIRAEETFVGGHTKRWYPS